MNNQVPRLSFRYALSVFLAGAAILFIELAGAKLLAPLFGSGLYVWSALITVTLLSMALGAWWGGWAADAWPHPRTLSLLWMGSSLAVGVAVPLRRVIFPLADQMDLRAAVILSALILFLPPLALLAAVTPVVMKLADPNREHLGRVVGRLTGLGTAGSCFGALATGFLLIPHVSLTRLFLYLSFALALYGLSSLWKGGKKATLTAFALVWGACLALFSPERPAAILGDRVLTTTLDTRQSLYGQVQIIETEAMHLLFLDGILQGGTMRSNGDSIAEYTAAMEILGRSAAPKAHKVLVIGLGAGILPTRLARSGFEVDTVEINPQVIETCRQRFGFDPPPGRIHEKDGRRYLRESRDKFDLVFLDAFSGEEPPIHLLTQEAFEEFRGRLSEKGVLVVNCVGSFEAPFPKVLSTTLATLEKVFPSVEAFSLSPGSHLDNFTIVARLEKGAWSPAPDVRWGYDKRTTLAKLLGNRFQPEAPYPFVFTDDYCPLEWLDRETRYKWRKESLKSMHLSTVGI